jgi:hypothetical protein
MTACLSKHIQPQICWSPFFKTISKNNYVKCCLEWIRNKYIFFDKQKSFYFKTEKKRCSYCFVNNFLNFYCFPKVYGLIKTSCLFKCQLKKFQIFETKCQQG